jgi:outer membrane protein assembly factor BamE (lipoprotein component of BamABCDE complex)
MFLQGISKDPHRFKGLEKLHLPPRDGTLIALRVVRKGGGKMKQSNRMRKLFLVLLIPYSLLFGCATAQQHQENVHGTERQMTLGIVQKEIHQGMSAAEVATALGSPNIVTVDSDGSEVWVYDKVSTDVTYSKSSMGGTALLVWGQSASGAESKTQKTLTVVIRFDHNKRVKDFTYHSSRF